MMHLCLTLQENIHPKVNITAPWANCLDTFILDVNGAMLPADVAYFCQPEGTHIESSAGGSAVRKDRKGLICM